MTKKIYPLLKWAGGKRWLINSDQMPDLPAYNRYIEPFLGGGAVLFSLRPKAGLVSDINRELINFYQVVRDNPHEVKEKLTEHQTKHCKTHYYEVRETEPEAPFDRATRFLYLNRACWNGLYRENLKGKFNVPIGSKTNLLFDYDDFEAVSQCLKKTDILCADFETTIDAAEESDLIFVDPPYTVKHNFNGFVKYNSNIFSWDDQVRLAASLKRAAQRGCLIIATNADHETVRELYRDIATYQPIYRHSVLAGNPSKRSGVSEAMFTFNI
ncbi:DNA adenine methylase [Celeribacter sp.]|uniref:DNA adenine methylase n=1 Tax=Celeribacter sp. TaxID=1890673 RepID=UPI003A8F654B